MRVKRTSKHWQAEEHHHQVPQAYWEQLQGTKGKQGPISVLRHTLDRYGVECPKPDFWSMKGAVLTVRDNHRLAVQMAEHTLYCRDHKRNGAPICAG